MSDQDRLRHERQCRFTAWLFEQYGQPYRPQTPAERQWIETGEGEDRVRQQRQHGAQFDAYVRKVS